MCISSLPGLDLTTNESPQDTLGGYSRYSLGFKACKLDLWSDTGGILQGKPFRDPVHNKVNMDTFEKTSVWELFFGRVLGNHYDLTRHVDGVFWDRIPRK